MRLAGQASRQETSRSGNRAHAVHLNGIRPGGPEIASPSEGTLPQSDTLPEAVDVLIVGHSPAGLGRTVTG